MNSVLKWCITAASLLVLFPLFVRAETVLSAYKPEKSSYGEKGSAVYPGNVKEDLRPANRIASNEVAGAPLKKIPEKESLSESQIDFLRAENSKLNKEIKKLNLILADRQYAFAILNRSFESIKDTSAEYTELEAKYNEAALMLSKQNKKVDDLEDEITRLLRQQNIRWFFSGAAVFLLGFIIGYSARREKRRPLL